MTLKTDKKESQQIINAEEQTPDGESVAFNLYQITDSGTTRLSRKTLTSSEINSLEEKLKAINVDDSTVYEVFLEKFNILKEYNFIPEGIEFEDVIDPKLLNYDVDVVKDENFTATTAPILFVGGGLGVGLGFPFILTVGAFLVALFGFGIALCYNIFSNTLYQLYTPSFAPMLIGLLAGFVGLILLPVVPGFFYSNFFAIGAVAYTSWIIFYPY
jgi:hypothetical protein